MTWSTQNPRDTSNILARDWVKPLQNKRFSPFSGDFIVCAKGCKRTRKDPVLMQEPATLPATLGPCFGETSEALAHGVMRELWCPGARGGHAAVPEVQRRDRRNTRAAETEAEAPKARGGRSRPCEAIIPPGAPLSSG